MSSLVLEYSRADTKNLVKIAFENTRGIRTYHDNGLKITGETGVGLVSYGERVIVEIPEGQASNEQTMISIQSEKEVGMNITANPHKYESRFLDVLNQLRGRPINQVVDAHVENVTGGSTKEVASTYEQAGGTSMFQMLVIIVLLIMIFFIFVPMILI